MSSSPSLSSLAPSYATIFAMTSTVAASAFVVRAPHVARKPMLASHPSKPLDVSILRNDTSPVVNTPIDESLFSKTKSLRDTLNVGIVPDTPVSRPLIIGHRGCLYEELENTREGFLKTYKMGADAVELDVFLLKCGTLVVFHGSGTDETPGLLQDYCVGRSESMLEYTYEELQGIVRFNEDYAEFGCSAIKIRNGVIPTLNQVLEDAKSTSLIIKIELKGIGTAEPVLKLVEEYEMQHQCQYSSFDLKQIAIIRALRPQRDANGKHVYKTGALFNDVAHDYLELAKQVGASEVHLRYDECTSERVQEIHAADMDSMAWFRGPIGMHSDVQTKFWDVGNEDYSMYQAVMQTGVRQMCVNRPDVLVNMFR